VTYSISSGADIDGDGTDDVTVDSSTGVVSYTLSGDGFDYETTTSYSLTFSASDGTTATSQVFTLNVTNVDEAPTLAVVLGTGSTAGTAQTLAEDAAAADTTVFTATATDPESATPTYTLTGTDAADFSISASGAVTLNTAGDYETKTSYALTINASDGTNSVSQAVTLALTNVNEAPDISVTVDGSAATAATVVEGTATSTTIFTVDDGDPDAGDSITYSLGAHSDATNDSAAFSIDQTTGVITFVASPDYETKTSYKLAVTASDGTLSDSQDLTVAVTDVAGDTPLSFVATTASATSGTTIEVRLSPSYVSGTTPSNLEGFQFDIVPDDGWDAIGDYVDGVLEYGFTIGEFDDNAFDYGADALNGAYTTGSGESTGGATSDTDPATIAWARILTNAGMAKGYANAQDVAVTEPGAPATDGMVLGTIALGATTAGSYTFTVDNVTLDFDDPLTDATSMTFTVDIV
jgi:hypothetical protein